MELEKLNLDNICNGAAKELFERELEKVMENIDDPNIPAQKERKINLEFSFKPTEGKEYLGIEMRCNSKLVSVASVPWGAHLSCDNGKLGAFCSKQTQPTMFDNVTPIAKEGENNA